jgi:hypothetical protein
MADNKATFDARLKQLERTYQVRMANGVDHVVQSDGLIVARARRRAPRIPYAGMFTMLVALIAFKVIVLIYLGETGYNQRIDAMRDGNVIDRAGAWVMQADTVSRTVASEIQRTVNNAWGLPR